MRWRLFIDDERDPAGNGWVIARTSAAAINAVYMFGIPVEIAFDHDLGDDDTSRKFVAWLTDYMITNELKFPADFTFSVHSQNPVGVEWIAGTMHNLIDYVGCEQ